MAMYLAVLGGVAVVEVHRAITGGNKDVDMLKKREDILRKQLQEIQKELLTNKEKRDLSEQEAAQLSAINAQLKADKDELSRRTETLQHENEELHVRADKLLERQQLLEQCAESLKLENSILIQQFDRLKLKYENENSAFQEKISELKTSVSSALQKFTNGDITAEQLIQYLGNMGVELRCPTEQVEKIPQRLAIAATSEDRAKALDTVELEVQDSWISQMKLVTLDPQRAARLIASSASNTPREPSTTTTTTAGTTTTETLTLEQRRIATPPRARETQAQKLTSHATHNDIQQDDDEKIGAVHSVAAITAAETTTTTAAAAGKTAAADNKKDKKAQGRSLLFRPATKKAGKKGKNSQLLEMEVETTGNSAVPRLAFDAAQVDELGGGNGNNTLMAL